ncbi:PLC-like phosphodiesterase [Amylocystis lapponica]|nr:PLC-like phosphodiesterase [Amylocystis lapponica]
MFAPYTVFANLADLLLIMASPAQRPIPELPSASGHRRFYDIQATMTSIAHRGGRGNTVENTLPSFAWGLIEGATTLELDNGITKDGVVVVWHDENIVPEKCIDTAPVTPDDPDFPYVGKYIANLTLAQLQTLDCGSKRVDEYPLQLRYPGTRISTLEEVFAFAECADPEHQILWNIESKSNAFYPNRTRAVEDFVYKQHALFAASAYTASITYQSFDWRTLVAMKAMDPSVVTSALIDVFSATAPDNTTTPWLAGLRLDAFPGPTPDMQVAQAAHAIGASVLSPSAETHLPGAAVRRPFATRAMIDEGHRLGMAVKPWTVNDLGVFERLLEWQADGVITDYPGALRRLAKLRGLPSAPKYPKQRVLACLDEHLARQH